MAVSLRNTNDALVSFKAILKGVVNSKAFVAPNGDDFIAFNGLVPAGQTTKLILRIGDVPASAPQSRSLKTSATFSYDVTYSFAQHTRTRHTSKTIEWQAIIPLQNAPGTMALPVNVIFLHEKEE